MPPKEPKTQPPKTIKNEAQPRSSQVLSFMQAHKTAIMYGLAAAGALLLIATVIIIYFLLSSSHEKTNPAEIGADCLEEHNNFREMHGVPSLVLSKDLSKYATEWAEELAKRKVLEKRENNKYGENIFMQKGGKKVLSPCSAVKTWYGENNKYRYDDAKFTPDTGHFTQVVWKNTKRLGCGMASNDDNTFVVCNYDPPANTIGDFNKNIPQRLGEH